MTTRPHTCRERRCATRCNEPGKPVTSARVYIYRSVRAVLTLHYARCCYPRSNYRIIVADRGAGPLRTFLRRNFRINQYLDKCFWQHGRLFTRKFMLDTREITRVNECFCEPRSRVWMVGRIRIRYPRKKLESSISVREIETIVRYLCFSSIRRIIS